MFNEKKINRKAHPAIKKILKKGTFYNNHNSDSLYSLSDCQYSFQYKDFDLAGDGKDVYLVKHSSSHINQIPITPYEKKLTERVARIKGVSAGRELLNLLIIEDKNNE